MSQNEMFSPHNLVSPRKQLLPDFYRDLDVNFFADTAAEPVITALFSVSVATSHRSSYCACSPRPIDYIQGGLCIEAVCRAADAFCTLVNYLHSVPQIWSIVNWAGGNRRGEKHKLCRTKGGSLQTHQDSFKVSFFLVYDWTCRLVKYILYRCMTVMPWLIFW